jgi:hypothetical protein
MRLVFMKRALNKEYSSQYNFLVFASDGDGTLGGSDNTNCLVSMYVISLTLTYCDCALNVADQDLQYRACS